MIKYYLTLILTILSIIGLNAQEKHVFSEKAKATFKKVATPESTLRWITIKETEKVPKDLFLEQSKEIFDLNETTTFKELRVNEGENGWKHHRLQQIYKGIPIEGGEYLLHEKDGLIETANGHVVAGLNLETTPSITEEVALQMLLNEIGAEKYAWEDDFSEKMLKHQTQGRTNCNSPQRRIQTEDENATHFPKGELIIATANEDFNSEDFALAYKFNIKTVQPFSHMNYIVDAFTGSIIFENSLLCQATGIAHTHRYGQQPITTSYGNGVYCLSNETRNIDVYNGLGLDIGDVVVLNHTDSDNIWSDPNQKSACEAHWVLGKTYDYFLNDHNWQGYDGFGSLFLAWTGVENNWNNVLGGGGEIYIGEGDGINYGPFTAIDVVAHEYTHSIIQSMANLQYSRESGALNESFCDIFGTVVEFYAEPNASEKDWLLGEDVSLIGDAGAFRDMSNPSLKGHPNTYEDDNWQDIVSSCSISNDNCGVHTNSGVQNHWFYILSNGKSGTNYFGYSYDIDGIGMTKAAKVAMENLKNYLGPFSDYADARNGAIEAANALGFTTNEINQVAEAWCAVGLGNCVPQDNCSESDSLALVALYNATDGSNWTNPWNLSQPVNTWYGITTLGCEVTEIFLYNNNLTGSIPSELGNLQNLQLLFLGEYFTGSLTGSIPSELGNLQNLQYLHLHSNGLTGSIPSELGNLQNLQHLELGSNLLTGSIPSELGNLQNLQVLNLSTSLTGSIPFALGSLQNLQEMRLANNSLTGPIPSALGNLQNLQYLDLGSNLLTGCYPLSLCGLTSGNFNFNINPGLPDNGSDQGFIDFCNGISPCDIISKDVYPGDLNFDGIVDHRDLPVIGAYVGTFGPSREIIYQDTDWYPHPSDDWGILQVNGIDIKNVDTDGNGEIDLDDADAITINYDKTHTASSTTNRSSLASDDPIQLSLQANGFGGNGDLILDIIMNDALGSELVLYGGYFTINYNDPGSVIEDIDVEFSPSWFGTPNEDFIYIVHNDDVNKKIDIGITKFDHQNSIGEGVIGNVIVHIDNSTPWDSSIAIDFTISDIAMQNLEGLVLRAGTNTLRTDAIHRVSPHQINRVSPHQINKYPDQFGNND